VPGILVESTRKYQEVPGILVGSARKCQDYQESTRNSGMQPELPEFLQEYVGQ